MSDPAPHRAESIEPPTASPHDERAHDATRTQAPIRCARCGYDVRSLRIGEPCPECGSPLEYLAAHGAAGGSGFAVASLVLGILSIPACFAYAIPSVILGGIGIYLGTRATEAIRNGAADPASRGLAQAGKVCSWIGFSLGALSILLFAAAFLLPRLPF